MSDNSQKTPLAKSLNAFATGKALDAIQLLGKALPASVVSAAGGIVTVTFELQSDFTLPQVTIPLATSQYIRVPLQPGDKGMVIPADARLGGVSGLGDGTATLDQPGNLSALAFVPLANSSWFAVDGSVLTMYGPKGVTLRNVAGSTSVKLADDSVKLTTPSASISVGGGQVIVTGELIINGMPYLKHRHMAPAIGQTLGVAAINAVQGGNIGGPIMSGAPGASV